MLTGLSLPMIALLAVASVLLDLLLGEMRRWHPLAGFGRLANALERAFNRGRYLYGALAWMLAVAPLVLLAYLGSMQVHWPGAAVHVVLLYFCLGLRSLRDHALPIEQALLRDDIVQARALTARIVSRDTEQADASNVAKAAAESMLENGNDAVFGTLFWFVIAGGPGAVLFRLANTLDAMWGYRTPRYRVFGCVAARIDDGLNWIPARLTALSYALLGNTRQALRCWQAQAPQWSSPNAGPVMAAGAGALGLALGGEATYDGVVENRPPLGTGRAATASDIGRAWRLVAKTTALWLAVLGMLGMVALVFPWKG